jgi:hypothetical protein
MAIQIIRIIDSDPEEGVLTFKNDNHTNNTRRETNAGRGDRIIWHIGANSGVAAITEISMKPPPPESTDIFTCPVEGKQNPGPVGEGTRNWMGQTKPASELAVDVQYNYLIKWIADDGSGEHTFDPKINLNT